MMLKTNIVGAYVEAFDKRLINQLCHTKRIGRYARLPTPNNNMISEADDGR